MKTLRGHCVIWSTPSRMIYQPGADHPSHFVEYHLRHSYRKLLAENGEILGLINHKTPLYFAKRSDGSLRIREDGSGLYIEMDLGPSIEKLARHAVGFSVCFSAHPELDIWNPDRDPPRRYVGQAATLSEVSIVTRPHRPALTTTIECVDRPDDEARLRQQVAAGEFRGDPSFEHLKRRVRLARLGCDEC